MDLLALGNVAAGASILAVNAAIGFKLSEELVDLQTEFLKGDGTVDTLTHIATVALLLDTECLDIVGGHVRHSVGIQYNI